MNYGKINYNIVLVFTINHYMFRVHNMDFKSLIISRKHLPVKQLLVLENIIKIFLTLLCIFSIPGNEFVK